MLEKLIAKRLADRDSILERMEISRSLIVPIRTLPSEIFGMISSNTQQILTTASDVFSLSFAVVDVT